ncbi:DUF5723 family protein [Bacteroidota bacterium]
MRNLIRYILAASLVALLYLSDITAQFGNTYYHMFGVPQANQLNPAFQPGCNGYLAIPFAGRVRFAVESNGLDYGDIFEWDKSQKKYITFMHPQGNKQKFMDALKPVNTIRAEVASNILSFGWRKEQLFFTFDLTERFVETTSFSKDFAEFLVYGNLNKNNFNFSDLAQNLMYYHQFAIGASYNFDDEMQFGIRAKVLLGGASTTIRSSDINLKTSMDEWRVQSDVKVDASIPYLEDLPVDQDGYLDVDSLANSDFDLLFGFPAGIAELLSPSGLSTIGGIKNPGFAIDFGFNYLPIEKLNISASVIDLGIIRWKNYVYNFQQDLDYTFNGIEFELDDNWSPGDGLLDSLQNDLKVLVTQEKFTTALAGKVYLGVAYDLTERVRFGGVFRTRIYNYKFYNQFTVSANVQPISMFSASLSYSVYANSYMNLGLGLSLRLGPLNVYFITDQAPSAYFWPEEFSSLNFRFGLNIVWGCRAIPKAMKDRPLID